MKEFISTKQFMAAIREGYLFKDKALGGQNHGEWTHLIQWWCLVEANKESQFLLVSPHELLRLLGQVKPDIWIDLFEIPLNYRQSFNGYSFSPFTNVLEFNEYLLSHECATNTPVLYAVIKGRANKREFQKTATLLFSVKSLFNSYPQQKKQNPEETIEYLEQAILQR